MSSESLPPDPQPDKPRDAGGPYDGVTTYVYDSQNQPASIDAGDGRGPVPASPHPGFFHWEHIPEKRLFALTADGSTEYCATIPHDFWWSRSMTKPARSSLPSRTAGPSTCRCAGRSARGGERATH